MTTPATTAAPALSPGLEQLQKPISSRYLSLPEREQIPDLSRAGSSLRSIVRALGRPASTISREITRNTGPRWATSPRCAPYRRVPTATAQTQQTRP